MVTHNIDVKNKITNGTRGVIEDIRYPFIKIKTLDDTLYDINYVSYQNDLHPDIQFEYIPLKLAYAITIHRSQGQTLDYVQMSLGNDIFEFGMAYVALSRAKNMKSIILTELSSNAFKTNHDVKEFYNDN
jgi:ATP-dependent DNA helicase PIF1